MRQKSITTLLIAATMGVMTVLPALSVPQSAPGPKGLFRQQLDNPKEAINTGLIYWIELQRNGVMHRVSNRASFRKGDQIKFHVKANIDGFAYILLSSGSRGEKTVLFPDPRQKEDNRVERGKDYTLPNDEFLTFDEYPGTEKVTLLLSRSPIDALTYLAKPNDQKVLVASASDGSKDLIPTKILVSIAPPPPVVAAATSDPKPVPVKVAEPKKQREREEAVVSTPPRRPRNRPTTASSSSSASRRHRPPTSSQSAVARNGETSSAADDEGTVTVVSENPASILHIDVTLDHR